MYEAFSEAKGDPGSKAEQGTNNQHGETGTPAQGIGLNGEAKRCCTGAPAMGTGKVVAPRLLV